MSRIVVPRAVLLIEIERRCADSSCNQKMRIGLTKDEARNYTGFLCERCEAETPDTLTARDVPEDWWQDFVLNGTNTVSRLSEKLPIAINNAVGHLSDTYRSFNTANEEENNSR